MKKPDGLILFDEKNKKRYDGRSPDEMRSLRIEINPVRNASGSAEIFWGNNRILVGVYGPHSAPSSFVLSDQGVLRCTYRMATFSVETRKSQTPTRREIELSFIMQRALQPALFLEEFPRSIIDVFAYVLNADGGTRAASISAASVALAASGLPMKGLVAACASGKVDGHIVMDINDIEDKYGEADMPVAVLFPGEEITSIQLNGNVSRDEFEQLLRMAIEGCKQVYVEQRAALTRHFEETRQEIESQYSTSSEATEEITNSDEKGGEKQ
ncbi:MAG: exosome complex exonuclease Rrp41 [Candidatus Korarchaeota archaeon]